VTAIAITRPVSRSIARCELTHLSREPIDYARASAQHEAYQAALVGLGYDIARVPPADEMPDAVFVEDIAIVLDELAIIARPGASSRRDEVEGVKAVLERYRRVVHIDAPGTLDGGDVLRADKTLFVGRSSRTNDSGIEQLRAVVSGYGYEVSAIDVRGCLHLKSAVTLVCPNTLLGNSTWVDRHAFGSMDWIEVDRAEPHAANALWLERGVIYPSQYTRTGEALSRHLEAQGVSLHRVEVSELAKAEGGVTCCSLIVPLA